MNAPPIALLCDAAFSALPILDALRRLGCRVAVCGSRTADPGHHIADISIPIDYADRDLVLEAARQHRVSFIVPGCTDVSYFTCSSVAAELGLPGVDSPPATDVLHRKDAFRAFCAKHRFRTPRSTTSLEEAMALAFPVLVKPTDAFSGRGIVKVTDPADLAEAANRARAVSKSASVVFEEFIEGPLHSHSAFIHQGTVISDFFVNEFCTVYPYQVNSSHLWTDVDVTVKSAMRAFAESCAQILDLATGLIHTQFITVGNVPFLIEVMRRCPGDLYAGLIERSTGERYASQYVSGFLGEAPAPTRSDGPIGYWSRHTVSVDSQCTYLASRLRLPARNVEFVPLKVSGERLLAAPRDRAGIYFIQNESEHDMQSITPRLRDFVEVDSF